MAPSRDFARIRLYALRFALLRSSCAFHSTNCGTLRCGIRPEFAREPALGHGQWRKRHRPHRYLSSAEGFCPLYGGVVGSPDQKDRFYDIRSDWPETEVRTGNQELAYDHHMIHGATRSRVKYSNVTLT